jgi:hypothetical protein
MSDKLVGEAPNPYRRNGSGEAVREGYRLTDQGQNSTDRIKETWPSSATIVELITTTAKRNGSSRSTRHYFMTTLMSEQ